MIGTDSQNVRWMWLIAALGLALRLYGLGSESLWLDEVVAAQRVHHSIGDIVAGWDSETQGPLYYLWLKAWGLMFGTDEWTLRIWSVIWGALTIPAVFFLGRHLFTSKGALLASAFTAVHPFAVYYSQEARPYALFLLLVTVSYYFLMKLLRQHSWGMAWLYLLTTTAAFYTHVFGVFLILSHALMYLWFRRAERFRGALRYPKPFVYTAVILLLLCVPEIYQIAAATLQKLGGESQASWIPKPTFLWLFKTPVEFFMDLRVGFVVLPIAGSLAMVRAVSEPQLKLGIQWLVLMCVCFFLLPWLISVTLTPISVTRYAAPGLLVVIYLMSMAAATLQALPRRIFVGALLALTAFPLWDYYTKIDKDPWRQTMAYVAERIKPDDRIIAHARFSRGAVEHYLPPKLRQQQLRPKTAQELESLLATTTRVWWIESYTTSNADDLAQIAYLAHWGTEARSVNMEDLLDMNPHRFWSTPIRVSLRESPPPQPPQLPPLPDS